MPTLLTAHEAAARLGVSDQAVYLAVQQQRLPARRLYGRLLVSVDAVDHYAAQLGQRNGHRNRPKTNRKEGE